MSNTIYINRFKYIKMMQDFLDGKLTGYKFMRKFMSQRSKDLNEDAKYVELKDLDLKYFYGEISEEDYNKLVKPLLIYKDPNLFLEVFDELQATDLEDFWPREDECFEEGINIDEEELRKRVTAKLQLLKEKEGEW